MRRDQYNVQVWNDQDFAWKENFKGDPLEIPANGHIVMNFYDAHEFKGNIVPLIANADGMSINPKCYKKIRVVEHEYQKALSQGVTEDELPEAFACNKCKKAFQTEASLLKHSIKEHGDEAIVDDEAEVVIRKKPGRKAKTAEANA